MLLGRASGDVREPHATFQMQPVHQGGCMTIVTGKNPAGTQKRGTVQYLYKTE